LYQQKRQGHPSHGLKKTWKIKLGHANGRAFFLRLTAMVGTRTKAGHFLYHKKGF
jgi:hypothetical protein